MRTAIDTVLLFIGISFVAILMSIHYRARKFFDLSLLGYVIATPHIVNWLVGEDPSIIVFVFGCFATVLLVTACNFAVNKFVLDVLEGISRIYRSIGSIAVLLIIYKLISHAPLLKDVTFGFDNYFITISDEHVRAMELVTVVLFLAVLSAGFLLGRGFTGRRFRAFLSDADTARAYGISETYSAVLLSGFTGLISVFYGVFAGPFLFSMSNSPETVSVIALSVVLVTAKRSVFFISCISLGFAVLLSVVSSNIETLSSGYRNIAGVFGYETDHVFSGRFVFMVFPLIAAVIFSWVSEKRKGQIDA